MKNKRLSSALGYLLVIIGALFTATLRSQSLVTEVFYEASELTNGQSEKMTSYQNDENITDVKFVTIGDLTTLQEDGILELNLPGLDCTPIIKAKHVEAKNNGDYFWYGEVDSDCLYADDEEDCFCFDGAVSLLSRNGDVIGTIQIDDSFFELFSLGEGKTVLVKRNENTILECGNIEEDVEESGQDDFSNTSSPSTHLEDRNFQNCVVKVLAVYTPAASQVVSNPEAVIEMTIHNTNLAFSKSGIASKQLKLDLVHTQLFNFTESPDHKNDIDTLVGNPFLQSLRDSVFADIVLVYTDDSYDPEGVAASLDLESESALSIIEIGTANWNHIGSHEIAHLFGCRHHIEADTTGVYEHAHDFKIKKFLFKWERRTIMWAGAWNGAILRFSNPDVNYGGEPTGTEEIEDNSRQLMETACTVGSFRGVGDEEVINASIITDGFGCPCETTTLHSEVESSSGPITYEWFTSTDGFNYGNAVGSTPFLQINMPCTVGDGLFVKLIVTGPAGVVEVTDFVESAFSWPGQSGECSDQFIGSNGGGILNAELIHPNLIVYPNPSTDIFSIFIKKEMPKGENISYQILDNNGAVVFSDQTNSTLFRLDLREKPPGIYLLFVKIGGETFSQKIIKH